MKGTQYMKTGAPVKHIAKRPTKMRTGPGKPTKQPKIVGTWNSAGRKGGSSTPSGGRSGSGAPC